MSSPILEIRDLYVEYADRGRRVKAVDGVSLSLERGRILALVGESGCGKTSTALAVLRLLPDTVHRVRGRILFEGRDLMTLAEDDLRSVRGREISMIFQDPMSGLNPVLTVGQQVEEIITAHTKATRREARRTASDALERLGLVDPERLARQYPYSLSGGMCQRVLIAIATVLNPRVIIADEPTSALDVTVQAAILNELERLRRERGVSIFLITHDLGVVAQMADEVAVMYAGRIAEQAPAKQLFRAPRHPYTWSLLGTLPRVDRGHRPLETIRGAPPDQAALPDECAFIPRCPKALMECRVKVSPPLREVVPGHRVACYNPVYHSDDQREESGRSSELR